MSAGGFEVENVLRFVGLGDVEFVALEIGYDVSFCIGYDEIEDDEPGVAPDGVNAICVFDWLRAGDLRLGLRWWILYRGRVGRLRRSKGCW